jgi:hypothetical protein|nr:hypothetical protein [uncultured Psychroserpens sp.]
MKILHYSNVVFYIVTVLAYVSSEVAVGLLFQFFLGIIQLLYFLICRTRENNQSIKKHLKSYALLVVFIFIIGVLLLAIQPYTNTSTFLIIIPMLIATYFVYITYLIQKQ